MNSKPRLFLRLCLILVLLASVTICMQSSPVKADQPEVRLIVNEVMSNPTTDWNHDGVVNRGDQWVELYRDGGSYVDLDGWIIDDGPGGSLPYRFDSFSTEWRYIVVFSSQTLIDFGQAGDVVRIYKPDGSLSDELEVPEMQDDSSASRYPDGSDSIRVDLVPTPLYPNGSRGVITPPTPTPDPTPIPESMTIDSARRSTAGKLVQIRGTVTAPPNSVGNKRMYVQDYTGGVLVLTASSITGIATGQEVIVTGTMGTYYGEIALRPVDGGIKLTGQSYEVSPMDIRARDIGPRFEGRLVRLSGEVSASSKPDIMLVDGSASIPARVHISSTSTVSWLSPQKGDQLQVTGILSSVNGRYRLVPRFNSDISITRKAEPPESKPINYLRTNIAFARTLSTDIPVEITGIVTAPPDLLGKGTMYVQDTSAGILVTGNLTRLQPGQQVTIRGRTSTYYSQHRIEADKIEPSQTYTQVMPRDISPVDIGPSTEGLLVRLSGAVSGSSWPSIYLNGGATRIYFADGTRIKNPKAEAGDYMTVVGIVSRWNDNYRVMPRFASDIMLSKTIQNTQWLDTTLGALRSLPMGTRVRFTAQVTAPPGSLGEERMYVGSGGLGIALHLTNDKYPKLIEGDVVQVQGVLDTYHKERIVRLESGSDITRLSAGAPVQPVRVSTSKIGRDLEGALVTIAAPITARSWPSLYMNDGSGEVVVKIDEGTGIPRFEGGKHDFAQITGIVSRWDDTWRLLPRKASDIQIVTIPQGMPATGQGRQS